MRRQTNLWIVKAQTIHNLELSVVNCQHAKVGVDYTAGALGPAQFSCVQTVENCSATPTVVYVATQAFGSEVRVQLIHYYAAEPGRQADAARALGIERAVVSANTRALLATGVLTQDEDRINSVNPERLEALITALHDFCLPSLSADS